MVGGARGSWSCSNSPPSVSFHRTHSVIVDCPFRLLKYRLFLLLLSACSLTNYLSLHRTLFLQKKPPFNTQRPPLVQANSFLLYLQPPPTHRTSSTMASDNAVHESICGWFLGPRAENATLFKQLLTSSIDAHVTRRTSYQADPPVFHFFPLLNKHLGHYVRTC